MKTRFTHFLSYSACLIFLFNFYSSTRANAQSFEWARSMGGPSGDQNFGIVTDARGNIYVAGYYQQTMLFNHSSGTDILTSVKGNDVFLAKYDADGNYQWSRSAGGNGTDRCYAIAVDKNGSIYLTGNFDNTMYFKHNGGTDSITTSGSYDVFIAKYDNDGNYQWAKNAGGGPGLDKGGKITVDDNDNLYLGGYFSKKMFFNAHTDSIVGGASDAFIAKYDINGNYKWAKSIGGDGYDEIQGIEIDASGNLFVLGSFEYTAYFHDNGKSDTLTSMGEVGIFMAKYNANGDYLWVKNIDAIEYGSGTGMAMDNSGHIYITGYFEQEIYFEHKNGDVDTFITSGSEDAFVAKFDVDGNYLWAKSIEGDLTVIGMAVAADHVHGGVCIIGSYYQNAYFKHSEGADTLTSVAMDDVFIAKYADDGSYLWAKSMGGKKFDIGQAVVVDEAGNICVAGNFSSDTIYINHNTGIDTLRTTGNDDVFIVKLNQTCEVYTPVSQSTCDSFTFNGTTYTVSGVYSDTFASVSSCDSIVTLNLTITGYTSKNAEIVEHYCDSVTLNGVTYHTTGSYTQHYINRGGCDSNITYNLTIGNTNSTSVTEAACGSYEFDGTTLTTSGVYFGRFANLSGCDSAVVLNLTITDMPEAIVGLSDATLSTEALGDYQWVNCDQDYLPISGATEQYFTPESTGNYAVIVSVNDCIDTSDCIFVEVADNNVRDLATAHGIRLYPNPVGNWVAVEAKQGFENATVRVVNIMGQVLYERSNQYGKSVKLDMDKYAPSLYFVEVNQGTQTARWKIVKE